MAARTAYLGVLRGAFRPADQVCTLRSYLRQRGALLEPAARAVQHMQKAWEQMNVPLTEVISEITGKTGMGILRAILAGERELQALAQYRDGHCQGDTATLVQALEGQWREAHLCALRLMYTPLCPP